MFNHTVFADSLTLGTELTENQCQSVNRSARPTWVLGVILRREAPFSFRNSCNCFHRFHHTSDFLNRLIFTTELTATTPPGITEFPLGSMNSTMALLRSGTFFLVPNPPPRAEFYSPT